MNSHTRLTWELAFSSSPRPPDFLLKKFQEKSQLQQQKMPLKPWQGVSTQKCLACRQDFQMHKKAHYPCPLCQELFRNNEFFLGNQSWSFSFSDSGGLPHHRHTKLLLEQKKNSVLHGPDASRFPWQWPCYLSLSQACPQLSSIHGLACLTLASPRIAWSI